MPRRCCCRAIRSAPSGSPRISCPTSARVNNLRAEPGFTGNCRGFPISVQSTGMGAPSLAIYVHELLDAYRVRTLIRVGTCGGLSDKVGLRSLVISTGGEAATARSTASCSQPFDYAPCADFALLCVAADRARQLGRRAFRRAHGLERHRSTIPTK